MSISDLEKDTKTTDNNKSSKSYLACSRLRDSGEKSFSKKK